MSWAGGNEDGWQGGLPALSLDRRELIQPNLALGGGETVRRLHLRLQLPSAGWFGALNITGTVVDWSWTPQFQTGSHGGRGHRAWRVVRFAGNAGQRALGLLGGRAAGAWQPAGGYRGSLWGS